MLKETQRFDLLGLLPCRSLEDSLRSPPLERSSQCLYPRSPQFTDVQEWEENWRDLLCGFEDGQSLERALMTLEDVNSSAFRSYASMVWVT